MLPTDTAVFHFRKGTLADAALLADLGWRTFEEAFAAYNKPEDMAAFKPTMYAPALQAAELADAHTRFIMAEAAGAAVAYLKLNTHAAPAAIAAKRPLQIDRLYIARQWTGQGLGALLMQFALDKAKEEGYDVVWLTVWEQNERAIRFYERYGFREMGELEFVLGQDVQRDLYMQRDL